MGVRAKVWVSEVAKTISGSKVRMNVVCRGEDNKVWSAATPSGSIELMILNELAAEQFEPGDEFYVDFTPAPKGEHGMGDDG